MQLTTSGFITMGVSYCEKHRRYGDVLTSPKFVAAAKRNESLDPDDIRYIQIDCKRRLSAVLSRPSSWVMIASHRWEAACF